MKRTAKHLRLRLLAATLAAASLLPAAAARADEGRTAADTRSAEELAAQAFELYKKGQYADAVTLYMRAYQAAPTGVLLFNVARIYDQKLRDSAQAAEYYRRALAAPDLEADIAKRARDRLTALREAEEAAKVAPAPAPARAAVAPAEVKADEGGGSWLRTGGLVAVGVGVVGLGVGGVFGLSAIGKNRDADRLCDGPACREERALALTDQARDAATVSTVCFVAGGVLVAGGLGAFLLAPSGRSNEAPSPASSARLRIAPAVGPRSAELVVAGGFW